MTESAFKRPPRMAPAELEELMDRIATWFATGDITQPGWFQAEHANASAPWTIRIDVEWPLGQARWGHSEMMPVDPEKLAPLAPDTVTDEWTDLDDEPLASTLLRWEVDDALEQLPTVERQCVEHVVFGQMSVRETGDLLGLSYPTVWRRVQSGKRKLAEILHHHG